LKAKVVLLARINDGNKYPFLPVEIKRGRPAPVDGIVTGYYLRYSQNGKRTVKPVGKSLDSAFVAYQNEELNQTRSRMGLASVNEDTTNRVRIADAVGQYVEDLDASVRMGKKSKKTYEGYRKAVEDFQKHCGVEYLDQITGRVLKAHERFLFENIKKRDHGKKANTIATRFRNLSAFLSKQGIQMVKRTPGDNGLLDRSDAPREERKQNIDKYSEDEIVAMLSVANVEEADLIQTFLRTGARDEEVAHLKWTDVDFRRKQIVISEKPEYGWRPKDKESRTIPVEDGVLLKRLAARKERQLPESPLVFPNSIGKPDMHLIRHLHNVVRKAKANGFDFEGEVALHKFRRTYASMMIAHSDLQTVSALLGHSDIKTTSRYLAPDLQKARAGSRTAFNGIGD
jgi:integrase